MQILTLEKDLARDREELRAPDRAAQPARRREARARAAGRTRRRARPKRRRWRCATARERLITLEDQLSTLGHESRRAARASSRRRRRRSRASGRGRRRRRRSRASLDKQLFRLTADGDEKRARRVRLEENIRVGEARAAELRGKVAATREELLRLAEERARAAEELSLKRTALRRAARRSSRRPRASSRRIRGELDGARRGGHAARGQAARPAGGASCTSRRRSAERYRLELWTQVHDHHLRPLAGEAEDRRAKELRDLIDRMGEINLNAIEEYNELETALHLPRRRRRATSRRRWRSSKRRSPRSTAPRRSASARCSTW